MALRPNDSWRPVRDGVLRVRKLFLAHAGGTRTQAAVRSLRRLVDVESGRRPDLVLGVTLIGAGPPVSLCRSRADGPRAIGLISDTHMPRGNLAHWD